jgi:hypothetical protein
MHKVFLFFFSTIKSSLVPRPTQPPIWQVLVPLSEGDVKYTLYKQNIFILIKERKHIQALDTCNQTSCSVTIIKTFILN